VNKKELAMRVLISALAVAGLVTAAFPSYGNDASDKHIEAAPAKPSATAKKVARPIDDATGKSGTPSYDPTMSGRSPFIDDGKAQSSGAIKKRTSAGDDAKGKPDRK
jgi:hypothetical protein